MKCMMLIATMIATFVSGTVSQAAEQLILAWSPGGYTATFRSSLQAQIAAAAGCTIIAVTVGEITDKTTWITAYDPSCTVDQETAGNAVITDYNVAAVQQAMQEPLVLAVGVTVSSTATPALDGIYALDLASRTAMAAVADSIANGQGLPGGGSTFEFPDAQGIAHTFTAAQFISLGVAVRDYLYAVALVEKQLLYGQASNWPSNVLSIP